MGKKSKRPPQPTAPVKRTGRAKDQHRAKRLSEKTEIERLEQLAHDTAPARGVRTRATEISCSSRYPTPDLYLVYVCSAMPWSWKRRITRSLSSRRAPARMATTMPILLAISTTTTTTPRAMLKATISSSSNKVPRSTPSSASSLTCRSRDSRRTDCEMPRYRSRSARSARYQARY